METECNQMVTGTDRPRSLPHTARGEEARGRERERKRVQSHLNASPSQRALLSSPPSLSLSLSDSIPSHPPLSPLDQAQLGANLLAHLLHLYACASGRGLLREDAIEGGCRHQARPASTIRASSMQRARVEPTWPPYLATPISQPVHLTETRHLATSLGPGCLPESLIAPASPCGCSRVCSRIDRSRITDLVRVGVPGCVSQNRPFQNHRSSPCVCVWVCPRIDRSRITDLSRRLMR